MKISDYEDLSKVSIADFKEAIYNIDKQIDSCLKNKNIKGFLNALKFKLRLNKLLEEKVVLVRKENNMIGKQR